MNDVTFDIHTSVFDCDVFYEDDTRGVLLIGFDDYFGPGLPCTCVEVGEGWIGQHSGCSAEYLASLTKAPRDVATKAVRRYLRHYAVLPTVSDDFAGALADFDTRYGGMK